MNILQFDTINWIGVTGINTSLFAKNNDSNTLKFDTNKLDLDKLPAVPSDIKKPTKFVEKAMQNCLVVELKIIEKKIPYHSIFIHK